MSPHTLCFSPEPWAPPGKNNGSLPSLTHNLGPPTSPTAGSCLPLPGASEAEVMETWPELGSAAPDHVQECSQTALTSHPDPPRPGTASAILTSRTAAASGATGASPWQPCQACLGTGWDSFKVLTAPHIRALEALKGPGDPRVHLFQFCQMYPETVLCEMQVSVHGYWASIIVPDTTPRPSTPVMEPEGSCTLPQPSSSPTTCRTRDRSLSTWHPRGEMVR